MTRTAQNNSSINTPITNPEEIAERLYKHVIAIMDKNHLESICLSDTCEKRIYIPTLQRYINYIFDEKIMESLVNIINTGNTYTASYTKKVYCGYGYVRITKNI